MLKSLYPDVEWEAVRVVGFDLDGTLYDEFDFIRQAYQPIAARLAAAVRGSVESVYRTLLDRWLEKGSSYPRIFEELLAATGVDQANAAGVVAECLELFRATEPRLALCQRVTHLLNEFSRRYGLFLVSDGRPRLQRAKMAALGLDRWFKAGNIVVSGEHGPEFRKPSNRMKAKVQALAQPLAPSAVVYFGDRMVDRDFAANAGFTFVGVHCLVPAPVRAAGQTP